MIESKFGYGDSIRLNGGRRGFVMCLAFPFRYDGHEHYEVIIDGRYRLDGVADCDLVLEKKWAD